MPTQPYTLHREKSKMSKTLVPEHLILMQGAEYVRSGIRRILPKLQPKEQRELGHLATVLTHSLKARQRAATPRQRTPRVEEVR